VEYEGNTKIKIKIKIIHPPPSSPSSIPHPPNFPSPPNFPLFLFFGEGTATATGSHHHRRSVAPPKGGGQSPPPFSPLRSLQIKHYLYIRLRE
jgi:hypothetical protein